MIDKEELLVRKYAESMVQFLDLKTKVDTMRSERNSLVEKQQSLKATVTKLRAEVYKAENEHLGIVISKNLYHWLCYLLHEGRVIDFVFETGETPLQLAKQKGATPQIIELLSAAEMLLELAKLNQSDQELTNILKILGYAVNARRSLDGNTALHLFIEHKNRTAVVNLLLAGADVTHKNFNDVTGLELARKSGDEYILVLVHYFNIRNTAKIIHVSDIDELSAEKAKRCHLKEKIPSIINCALEDLKTVKENKEFYTYLLGVALSEPSDAPVDTKNACKLLMDIPKESEFYQNSNSILKNLLKITETKPPLVFSKRSVPTETVLVPDGVEDEIQYKASLRKLSSEILVPSSAKPKAVEKKEQKIPEKRVVFD